MISPGLRFGRYEVGDRIGKGGFGVVHFARDVELGRELAIKFLRAEYQVKPHVVQRFLQEARAAARIGHPGIVTVFECGQIAGTGLRADGTAFIAMELLKGRSLSETLDLSGRMSLALALSIGRQLAAALASAHGAGIIHRDLKPDNVFLIPDPAVRAGVRVKILDFGVAKLAEPDEVGVHTHSQVMLGTPRYMAPEQARSAARVDHRSDIYALGCILYELLCGRPPYSGEAADVIMKHQSAPVPPLRKLVDSTPQELDRLILTMLAKAPEERPKSMTEVDATLGTCETAAMPRAGSHADPAEEATIVEPTTVPVPRQPPAPEPAIKQPAPGPEDATQPVLPRLVPGPEEATRPVLPQPLPGPEEATQVRPPDLGENTMLEATSVRLPQQPLQWPAGRTLRVAVVAGAFLVGGLATGLIVRSCGDGPGGGSVIADAAVETADAAVAVVENDPPPILDAEEAPPPPCDAEALGDKGREHNAAGEYAAALEHFEKAWACKPDPSHAMKALIVACNQNLVGKARLYWRRLSEDFRVRVVGICLRNGIDESTLNEPDAKVQAGSNDQEVECLRYQREGNWADLDSCADRLAPANPKLAKELKTRAALETRIEVRIAAFEAALKDKNLKQAKAELDKIPPGVTRYAAIRQKYVQAEQAAIAELVGKLKASLGPDCKAYDQLIAQEKNARPLRVAQEAQKQVKCAAAAPPRTCDAEALAEKGRDLNAGGQYAAALEAFEKAFACKPDQGYVMKAVIVACNASLIAKAKQNWRRLTPGNQAKVSGICVRNGIDETTLNAP